MKESILLFGFSGERQRKVVRALLPLKIKIKKVEPQELSMPLGVLAGLAPADAALSQEPVPQREQWELGDEMLVMAGLGSTRVDAVLMALRRGKAGPVPYKAVLTEANQQWNAHELLLELKKEHARFSAETPGDSEKIDDDGR